MTAVNGTMNIQVVVVFGTPQISHLLTCVVPVVVVLLIQLTFAQALTMVLVTLQGTSATGTLLIQIHAETMTLNSLKQRRCVVNAKVAALTNQEELLIALVTAVDGTKIVNHLVATTTLNLSKPTICAVSAKVACKP